MHSTLKVRHCMLLMLLHVDMVLNVVTCYRMLLHAIAVIVSAVARALYIAVAISVALPIAITITAR
jgi:hypothetical protein